MRPRRTPTSNKVWRLAGGNEDNDLWVETKREDDGTEIQCSVFELSVAERQQIAEGANVALYVWGMQPPVALAVYDGPLGKAP